jgi:hypothetical protein
VLGGSTGGGCAGLNLIVAINNERATQVRKNVEREGDACQEGMENLAIADAAKTNTHSAPALEFMDDASEDAGEGGAAARCTSRIKQYDSF